MRERARQRERETDDMPALLNSIVNIYQWLCERRVMLVRQHDLHNLKISLDSLFVSAHISAFVYKLFENCSTWAALSVRRERVREAFRFDWIKMNRLSCIKFRTEKSEEEQNTSRKWPEPEHIVAVAPHTNAHQNATRRSDSKVYLVSMWSINSVISWLFTAAICRGPPIDRHRKSVVRKIIVNGDRRRSKKPKYKHTQQLRHSYSWVNVFLEVFVYVQSPSELSLICLWTASTWTLIMIS